VRIKIKTTQSEEGVKLLLTLTVASGFDFVAVRRGRMDEPGSCGKMTRFERF
jgi:hypothetical protein